MLILDIIIIFQGGRLSQNNFQQILLYLAYSNLLHKYYFAENYIGFAALSSHGLTHCLDSLKMVQVFWVGIVVSIIFLPRNDEVMDAMRFIHHGMYCYGFK